MGGARLIARLWLMVDARQRWRAGAPKQQCQIIYPHSSDGGSIPVLHPLMRSGPVLVMG